MIKDYIKTEDLNFVVGLAAKFKTRDPRILGTFREGWIEIRRESWGRLTVCATDGRRLAVTRQQGYKNEAEPWKVVLTYTEAKRLLDLCKASGGRIELEVHHHREFELAKRLVANGKTFEGVNERFPDFKKVQPETFENSVDLPSTFVKTLRGCIDKLETFTTKEKVAKKVLTHKIRTIQLSIEQGYVQIAKGQIGNVGEDDKDVEKRRLPIYAHHDAPENVLASILLSFGERTTNLSPIILNADYLLEGVRGLGSDVTFHSNGPLKSLTFSDPYQQNVYLLMPIKGSVYR